MILLLLDLLLERRNDSGRSRGWGRCRGHRRLPRQFHCRRADPARARGGAAAAVQPSLVFPLRYLHPCVLRAPREGEGGLGGPAVLLVLAAALLVLGARECGGGVAVAVGALEAGVAGADLVQGVGHVHLTLGVDRLGLELLHAVLLLLFGLLGLQPVQPLLVRLIGPYLLPPRLHVALGPLDYAVVLILGVGAEDDLPREGG